MSYRALGKFTCDGCKVIDSGEVALETDFLGPLPPASWMRVETVQRRGELEVRVISHYCPACAPLIQSYLAGRTVAEGGHA